MPLIQTPLPYDKAALEPYMSSRTLDFHYGKHHKAYVDNTNAAIKGTALDQADLETIIKVAQTSGDRRLFNNSAQVWNHDFFWKSMTPGGGGAPTGLLADTLARDFGSVDQFKQAFKAEAVGHFASGWAWLVLQSGELQVTSYHDADSPIARSGVVPIITVDVWEHAYYLDFQNARGNFLDMFFDHLANWDGAGKRLENALHR